MEGFRQPKLGNFTPDHVQTYYHRASSQIMTWRCVICGTPGIRDRMLHNTQGCAPIGWLDPMGVFIETLFALWGPNAEDVVQVQLPEIPKAKSIKVEDLPYFTKPNLVSGWMVIGHKALMAPGSLVEVNVRGADPACVYIEEWRFQRHSPATGNTYIMATYRSAGKD